MNNVRYVVRRQRSVFETRHQARYEPQRRICFESWREVSFETRADEMAYRSAAATSYMGSPYTPGYSREAADADTFNMLVNGEKMTGKVIGHRFNLSMSGGGTTTMIIDCRAAGVGNDTNTQIYLSFP